MEYLTPQIIAEVTQGKYVGNPDARVTPVFGAVRDNRGVKPGNLFVCIRGARTDGHFFADSAFESGAACCLAEREIPNAKGPYVIVDSTLAALKTLGGYYRRLFNIPIIGVTGSVGKTTAKDMIAAALGQKYTVLKTPDNLNNEIGVPLTLLSLSDKHGAAVIEMGISEFGEMARLGDMVRPDICLMTKIGYSHLETLGDLHGVLKAKSEVFAFMRPDSVAVVNGDDALLRRYNPGVRKIMFGVGADNHYYADNIMAEGTSAVTCDIVHAEGRFHVKIPAFGSHMVFSALPAVIIGRLLGMTEEDIRLGLLSYVPSGSRAGIIDTGRITIIDDCYNANPNSMSASLRSLSSLPGRRAAILGDMKELGGGTDQLHREIGVLAGKLGIELLICCGDKALHIYNGFVSCGTGAARHFTSKEDMFKVLPELIARGDSVLVKASHSMNFNEITEWLKSYFVQCNSVF